jgi:hypothetical protein
MPVHDLRLYLSAGLPRAIGGRLDVLSRIVTTKSRQL